LVDARRLRVSASGTGRREVDGVVDALAEVGERLAGRGARGRSDRELLDPFIGQLTPFAIDWQPSKGSACNLGSPNTKVPGSAANSIPPSTCGQQC